MTERKRLDEIAAEIGPRIAGFGRVDTKRIASEFNVTHIDAKRALSIAIARRREGHQQPNGANDVASCGFSDLSV